MTTKPMTKLTRERFYPEHTAAHGFPLLQRHINRYKWAGSKMKANDIVLDCGCGSGYFDYILLNTCEKVHGIDISAEAIQYAKWKAEKTKNNRLFYERKDMTEINYEDKFDTIVCIEAIEHLAELAQEIFLTKVEAALRKDGTFLVTTPRAGTCTTDFHLHEFKGPDFIELLDKHFDNVTLDQNYLFKIPDNFMLVVCSGPKKVLQ